MMKKRLFSLLMALALCLTLLPTAAFAAEESGQPHTHCVCGGSCATMDPQYHSCSDSNNTITFEPWNSETSLPSSGNYYLTKDVTISSSSSQPVVGENYGTTPATLNLCLNGKEIFFYCLITDSYPNGEFIAVANGSSFTLTDCQQTGIVRTTTSAHKKCGIHIQQQYGSTTTFNMYGGTITGFNGIRSGYEGNGYVYNGGAVYNEGTFHMYGGTISGNTVTDAGGGVYNANKSTFHMYGGTISNNKATGDANVERATGKGGGVYNDSNSTFRMYGGTISGNEAADQGGGVFVNIAKATLSGGSITGNTAGNAGGGVYNLRNEADSADGALHLTGTASISSNKAKNGAGVYNYQHFYMSGGSITGNEASECGGGVYHDNSSTLRLSGGSITQNSAATNGGGVYISYPNDDSNSYSAELSGSIRITGNKQGTAASAPANDLFLEKYTHTFGDSTTIKTKSFVVKADAETLFTGSVGIASGKTPTAEDPVTISRGSAAHAGHFTSNNDAYMIRAKGDDLLLALKPTKETVVSVNAITATYGDTLTITGTATASDSQQSIAGTWSWKGGNAPKNVSDSTSNGKTWTVVFTPTGVDAATYKAAETTVAVTIQPKTLTNEMISLGTQNTYSGESQNAVFTVNDGEALLTENTDYTVTAEGRSATDVGDTTLTITGAGNYTGTATRKWSLERRSVSDAVIGDIGAYTYQPGGQFKPEPSVTVAGKALTKDVDFEYGHASHSYAGSQTLQVIGKGNYTGFAEKNYQINAATQVITLANGGSQTIIRNGKGNDISGWASSNAGTGAQLRYTLGDSYAGISLNGTTLTAATDSTATSIQIKVNSDAVCVNSEDETPEFTAAEVKTITVTVNDMTQVAISGLSAATGLVYDGTAKTGYTGTPSYAPAWEGTLSTTYYLDDGMTKTNAENSGAAGEGEAPVNAGSYKVVVAIPESDTTYTGSVTFDFTIGKKALNDSDMTVGTIADQPYNGSAQEPTVVVKHGQMTLTKGRDYTVSYANNTNAGTASATITGVGNYTDTTTKTWTIQRKTIYASAVVTEKTYDGTTSAEVTIHFNTPAAQGALVTGDSIIVNSVTGTFDNKNVGTQKVVTINAQNAVISGSGSNNYEVIFPQKVLNGVIKAKPVDVTVTATNKVYDGNVGATVTAAVTSGLVEGDSIVISGLTGTFDNADAGESKTVTVDASRRSITGHGVDNYELHIPATTTASISRKAVTITVADKSAYRGSEAPDLSAPVLDKDYTVDGLLGDDALTVAPTLRYDPEPDMSVEGDTTAIRAGGADAGGNYTIEYVDGKLTITRRPVPAASGKHHITVEDTENGSVTVEPSGAKAGETVSVTVTPDAGYAVEDITITDRNGNKVKFRLKDGKYIFEMPESGVTVQVEFARSGNPFVDVPEGKYFYDAVLWAVENGITGGTDATHFSPYASCTRGQLVTFLWRAAGCPAAKTAKGFSDVEKGRYCEDAVAWAAENGIVGGYDDGTFRPDATVTRQQTAAILWRFAKYAGMDVSVGEDTNILSFSDALAISDYAFPAIQWAVGAAVMGGSGDKLLPRDTCTRAQIVTMLYRCLAE